MTKILGISGRKQCGKNTTANFLIGLTMTSLGIVRGRFKINETGQIWITDLFGDKEFEGVFDVQRDNENVKAFCEEHLNPYIKLYSFADLLKQHICIDILGLSHNQCYGSDADKNGATSYKWSNMPGVITNQKLFNAVDSHINSLIEKDTSYADNGLTLVYHEDGFMSARDVMQYVGTEIFRKMCPQVWVESCIRRIESEDCELALICDVRFPNEVTGVQAAGGKVLRLTRNPCTDEDTHDSENALDKDRFDWNQFDWVVENADVSIPQHCRLIYEALQTSGWIPEIIELPKDASTDNLHEK